MTLRRGDTGHSPDPKRDRKQVSLMHVFRSAMQRGDARDGGTVYRDGDREVSLRSKERREGTDEETLRRHLTMDMASLMNTINLAAVVDLADYPYIRKSVINFGFEDLSTISDTSFDVPAIAALIRETLMQHEPRLIPGTIDVQVNRELQSVTQRMTFDITAEMVATPVDVPLGFVAELDMGAGKIQMTKLRVRT